MIQKLLLAMLIVAACSCGVTKKAGSGVASNGMEPLRIAITVKQENDAVNRVMAVFTAVQNPDQRKVYYPATPANATVIDYTWKEMRKKDITKLKAFCEQLPEKISVDYDSIK